MHQGSHLFCVEYSSTSSFLYGSASKVCINYGIGIARKNYLKFKGNRGKRHCYHICLCRLPEFLLQKKFDLVKSKMLQKASHRILPVSFPFTREVHRMVTVNPASASINPSVVINGISSSPSLSRISNSASYTHHLPVSVTCVMGKCRFYKVRGCVNG
jgi:hypothetical protein